MTMEDKLAEELGRIEKQLRIGDNPALIERKMHLPRG